MKKKRTIHYVLLGFLFLLLFCGCGKADRYYKNGLNSMEENDPKTALVYFDKAIEKNKNRAEYFLNRGFAYCQLKEYEQARKDFDHIILDSELPLAKQNNKRARRGIGITYYEEKEYDKANEYFTLALQEKELPELDSDIRMYLADTYESKKDYASAILVYNEILERQKDYSAGYRARAYMEYELSLYTDSLADFDRAIALEPENLTLFFGKYNVLEKLGKKEEQKQLLKRITDMENKSEEDNYLIAKANFFCGNYETAEVLLKEAGKSGFSDAEYYLGEIFFRRANYQEAFYHFKEYLSNEGSQDATAYNQAAVCLFHLTRYEEANQLLTEMKQREVVPDNQSREQLAENTIIILEKIGDYEKAKKTAEEYHQLYPGNRKIGKELLFLQTRVDESKN